MTPDRLLPRGWCLLCVLCLPCVGPAGVSCTHASWACGHSAEGTTGQGTTAPAGYFPESWRQAGPRRGN